MIDVKVHVGNSHIQRGSPMDGRRCAVYLALFDSGVRVRRIWRESAEVYNRIEGTSREIVLPDEVISFMREFDYMRRSRVFPIAFNMSLKKGEMRRPRPTITNPMCRYA